MAHQFLSVMLLAALAAPVAAAGTVLDLARVDQAAVKQFRKARHHRRGPHASEQVQRKAVRARPGAG